MARVNGLHHLAIASGNLKEQIEFFSDVLGMELVALYWMHGVPNTMHGFLRLNDQESIAFVYNPDIASVEPQPGVSHAGNAGGTSAPGTMQHLALKVDNHNELIAMRDRIRSRGVIVFGPVDHGFCQSIYFAGPENLTLEVSTSAARIDPNHWIDPEVVALAGISDEELQRYLKPAPFTGEGGAIRQPGRDPAKPHQIFPEGVYEHFLQTSDEEFGRMISVPEPPVPYKDGEKVASTAD